VSKIPHGQVQLNRRIEIFHEKIRRKQNSDEMGWIWDIWA